MSTVPFSHPPPPHPLHQHPHHPHARGHSAQHATSSHIPGDPHVHYRSASSQYPPGRSQPPLPQPPRFDHGGEYPMAEHLLRRKTPAGTLSSAYDGSLFDQPGDTHDAKRVHVVPESIARRATTSATSLHRMGDGQLPLRSPVAYSPTHMDQPYSAARQGFMQNFAANTPDHLQYPGPAFPMVQMDSMLNQIPVLTNVAIAHQYPFQRVPRVIQPGFQNPSSPTVSNDQGPFGPYWPNGTYVPYRPAALQDPRYLHQHAAEWYARPESIPYPHTPSGWYSPSYPSDSSVPVTPSYAGHPQRPMQHLVSPGFRVPHTPTGPQPSPQHLLLRPPIPSPSSFAHSHTVPQSSSGAFSGDMLSNQQYPSQLIHGATGHHTVSQPTPRLVSPSRPLPVTAAVDTPHRDKIFASALQAYKEMIAFIHQTRKANQHRNSSHSQHHPVRPNIYPKPPKHPYTVDSPERQSPSKNSYPPLESPQASRSSEPRSATNTRFRHRPEVEATTAQDNSTSSTSPTRPLPPQKWPSDPTLSSRRRLSHPPTPLAQPVPRQFLTPQNELHHHPHAATPTSLRTTPTSALTPTSLRSTPTSALIPVSEAGSRPLDAAHAALDAITRFCQQSNWQWIPGMLLGGCLAYGLGDYERAFEWYERILKEDSRHVEAIANQAATLLALGKRQEAEKFWSRAIHLRPSYFEAVEHLVGLLCTDRRGKEAVAIIDFVETQLRLRKPGRPASDSTISSTAERDSPAASEASDKYCHDGDADGEGSFQVADPASAKEPGFGSSGYAIPGGDNGRMLALLHAKGNMQYALGDNAGAARSFEDAVLLGVGRRFRGVQGLVEHILAAVTREWAGGLPGDRGDSIHAEPVLLPPDRALLTARLCFAPNGDLPGLSYVNAVMGNGMARKAAVATTSNALLSLAKIFQDGMNSSNSAAGQARSATKVREILALYYLSLALQPSPSTANNVGILLASVQQTAASKTALSASMSQQQQQQQIPGVVPGGGVALALAYYNYGLNLDNRHAHLYTNLGSLLKDIGQLSAAIGMYQRAVSCDGNFDIALANLANAVKDQGRVADAITYYKRAVHANPDFAEAVCGLANALNSVCSWAGRGGIVSTRSPRDRWHVDTSGMLVDTSQPGARSSGWLKRVIEIVDKQLRDGEDWGRGVLTSRIMEAFLRQLTVCMGRESMSKEKAASLHTVVSSWAGQKWEGARIVRLVERATRLLSREAYLDAHVRQKPRTIAQYVRPQLPAALTMPTAPTVLPFHTFTCPMSAEQIRLISQRNALRISCSTLRSPWVPSHVYPPPPPPNPALHVGYVSSDFNNHPLAHLMQSVFGMHDTKRVKAYCYATTASDESEHRHQIEREAPVFHDASQWSLERLVNQIVADGIHILVNLNGYTRGARNEVFAARPAPIHMSFMGFAGTLGAEWCDYLLADKIAIPPSTLRPWRRNVDLEDQAVDENCGSVNGGNNDESDWIYGENVIYCRDTFFCCDHRQSAPGSQERQLSWDEEQRTRWQMRKELFPDLPDDAIILGNFNQLYKIEPTTFRTWLRILARVEKAVLWLLRFPDLGETHLMQTALAWSSPEVASRIFFTDVALKQQHISRARVCDIFLDTPECNAHTTAADVLWSGTPLLTYPRYDYKMCSRMAASILRGALPRGAVGDQAARELTATSDEEYENRAVALAKGLKYIQLPTTVDGKGGRGIAGRATGRLMELRRLLYESRWQSPLFDTRRWVHDLEDAYHLAWKKWVAGEGGDIDLETDRVTEV